MGTQDRAGYAVAVMLILAVAGAAFAFGNLDDGSGSGEPGPDGTSSPATTPAPLPTEVRIGSELDPESGQVAEQQLRFEAGSTIAFSLWLGQPVGSGQVRLHVLRLESSGFRATDQSQVVQADPDALLLSGELPADLLLEALGAGTYLLDVERPPEERLGYGVFQLETAVPEDIQIFHDGPRSVGIAEGEYIGYQFDAAGEVVGEKPYALGKDSGAPSDHRAVFGGQSYLFITEGVWAGFYLPETEGVTLRAAQP